ncbi:MAG: TonB-dependent receptor [Melioribacteraceae bacterium]|nr:TonB-dependent receptor [Melioribacteraceae bacterium]
MQTTKSYLILLLFAIPISIWAQPKGTIRGIVTDSTSGEVLAYANILIEELGSGATTDIRGYFVITSIPANNTYTLLTSYVGYNSKKITAAVKPNQVTEIDVELSPQSFELQTVEKVAEKVPKENATDISLERIAIKDIEMLPKGVETDILRAIKFLPGVQSTGDVSARYYVRGGAANQNLVLLNGATIYNPFHALGLFSVVDPEMINSVEFYKGGFGAEYSGRISSVLNLVSKDGNKYKYGGKASASFLTAKASLEGPLPHGSFLVTGRKSHSNSILKKFLSDQNVPVDFYDFSFKLNYEDDEFMEDAKFTFHGFFSEDNIDNSNPLVEDFKWANSIIGVNYFQLGDAPLFYNIGLSVSKFNGELIPNGSNKRPRKNEVDELSILADFTYVLNSKDEFGVGWHIKEFNSNLFLYNYRGVVTDIGSKGSNISVYGKYKYLRNENFGADLGMRVNLTRFSPGGGGTYFIEPRLNITYRFAPFVAFKGAWGIFQQDLTTLTDEDEVITLFDPWLITPNYIDPARSFHYIAGLDFDITEEVDFLFESYYKLTHNFPFLNENRIVPTDPELIAGIGESYGFEFSTIYNTPDFSMRSGYTLSWTFKEVDGKRYHPRYDSRHNFNLSLDLALGAGWRLSSTWTYSSGLPFTQFRGYYQKLALTDLYQLLPDFNPKLILNDRNLGRMPDYHRMDISFSKKIEIGLYRFTVDLSVLNLYDRANLFYFDRTSGARINMLPFLPTATIKVEI